jgi:hypothetical protein
MKGAPLLADVARSGDFDFPKLFNTNVATAAFGRQQMQLMSLRVP